MFPALPLSVSPHETMCQVILQYLLQFPCAYHHTRPQAKVFCKMCCKSPVYLSKQDSVTRYVAICVLIAKVCCKMFYNSPYHLTTQDHMPRCVARCFIIPLTMSPHNTTCRGLLQDVLQFSQQLLYTRAHAEGCCKMCCHSPSISSHQTK